jgi:hypothetical protein
VRQLLILGRNPGINELVEDILKHEAYSVSIISPPRMPSAEELGYCAGVILDEEENLISEISSAEPSLPIVFLCTIRRPIDKSGLIVISKPFSVESLINAVRVLVGPAA